MSSVPKLGMEAPPLVEACAEFVDGVACRDVPLRELVWVRIFFPRRQPDDTTPKPVVLYAHGGGYCFGQPDWVFFHSFCASMARESDCIWVSLSYRLAPAHRLPAAYDDASFALRWLASQAQQQALPSEALDPWLKLELADFSNCFLAGESAGAAIVLKAAMDANLQDLKPLCIKGLLLVHPGFHSEEKKGRMVDKELANLQVEQLYAMALPEGETLDYPPVNPIHAAAPPLTPLSAYPHILICVAEKDFRYDMTVKFDRILRGICRHVVLIDTPGKGHAFHIFDRFCKEAQDMREQLASFIRASIAN